MNDTGLNEYSPENSTEKTSEHGEDFWFGSEDSTVNTMGTGQEYNTETEQTRPLTVKEYFCMYLWMLIPIANIVFMIRWAIGGSDINVNKTNLWRGYLITMAIFAVLSIVLAIVFAVIAAVIGAAAFSSMIIGGVCG